MTNSATDRNLLFGLIAMQTGLITRENLMTATGLWLQDKSQPMDELLLSQKFITGQQHGLLSELVNMHLDKHDGDAERSLAAVDAISSVRDELCELGDEEVEQTLGHIHKAREWASGDDTMLWTPPEPGQRFRILRPHAKGGLGIVNIAHDAELNREVALKEIQPEQAEDPDSRSRFVQEAEITGGLEHPGIVPVYGLGTHDDNRPYYAMRLIRGDTLEDAIKRYHDEKQGPQDVGSRRLEMRRLLTHFISLCNAIEYAHSRGILHRDIKPANVMLGKYGETLVVDWGLAKPIDRKEEYRQQDEQTLHPVTSGSSTATQIGSAVGTPSYMSPEQAAGRLKSLGTTSDVYSLGATLYCIITGQPSLADTDVQSAIRKTQSGDFPPPRSIKSNVPRALESVCLKAMALKPGDRYPSAAALSADVERLLADEPVKAHSESFGERLTRLARRHRAWFRAGAAALLLITVGSVVATLLINAARQDQAQQRVVAEKQLRRSDQLRLASQAATLQEMMPQRTLLLAIESIELARKHGDKPPQLAYEVLHSTLASTGGEQIFRSDHYFDFTEDGRWLSTIEGPGTRRFYWRLEAGETEPSQKITLGDLPDSFRDTRSSSGRWWAVGDDEGMISLYDFAAPDPSASRRQWSAHHGSVNQMAFLADSGRLISASASDEVCKLWNFQQEEPELDVTTIPEPFERPWLSVSPDGKSLAISEVGKDDLLIWDISPGESPRQKLTLKLGDALENGGGLVFSPDGRFLAAADNNRVIHNYAIRLWDLEADSPSDSAKNLGSHDKDIRGLVFTPDGQNLISYSFDGTARQLPVGTDAREVILRGHEGLIVTATLSSSGQILATGSSDNTIRLWDLDSDDPNENVRVLRGHDGLIDQLVFSPRSEVLYSLSRDGTARKWRLGGEQVLSTRRMIRSTSIYSFGGGSAPQKTNAFLVARLSGGKWMRWNFGAGDLVEERLGIPKDCDLVGPSASIDGRWLLSWLRQPVATLFDLRNGPDKPSLLELKGHDGPVLEAQIDPDSRYAITLGRDNRIVRWDLTADDPSADPEQIAESPTRVTSSTLTPDGRWLFAASDDGLIRRWDLDADDPAVSEMVLEGHQKSVYHLIVSPDGRLLASTGLDLTLRLWQLETSSRPMESVEVIQADTPIRPEGLVFSPDSRYLVASESSSTEIHAWDTTAELVADSERPFTGHSSEVQSIAFHADGRTLASGELNGDILIWDRTADEPEKTALRLRGHTNSPLFLGFLDNDRWLLSIGYDATARIWELDPDRLLKLAHERAGRDLTDAERELYGLGPASNDGP